MDASVIIVTRNTAVLTSAATRSVRESADMLRKEIIVVDNASTDSTPAVFAREFPEVKYLRSETNLGFARANNLGAREAQGEFLLLLNSDARLQPDSLRLAVEWMKARPDCGIAGAQLLNPDGSRQNSIANFPTLATELLNKSLLRRLFPRRFPGKERQFAEPVEVESVIGAFMLIRAAVWRALGGLDERYFFFFEETDFCLQARRQGWKVLHLPQVKVWHEQGKSAGQVHIPARLEYWRSRYAYFRKNHGGVTRLVLATGLLLRLVVNWMVATMATAATLGRSRRWRKRWDMQSALGLWHLRGCPEHSGLPR